MLNFRKIDISDKPLVDQFFKRNAYMSTDNCFPALFIWQDYYGTEICFYDGFLFFRTGAKVGGKPYYLFPSGENLSRAQIELLRRDAHSLHTSLRFTSLNQLTRDKLLSICPGEFDISPVRSSFDYIYLSEKLISLSGKKLHSKRNFINRFSENYAGRWHYQAVNFDDRYEIFDFWRRWHDKNIHKDSESLSAEFGALENAMLNFDSLGLRAGVLRLDAQIIAFSLGCPITNDVFDVQIEKAYSEFDGAYAVINREFAAANCSEFKYINREEDLGSDGLRKAKLSYHPEFLIEKFTATEI